MVNHSCYNNRMKCISEIKITLIRFVWYSCFDNTIYVDLMTHIYVYPLEKDYVIYKSLDHHFIIYGQLIMRLCFFNWFFFIFIGRKKNYRHDFSLSRLIMHISFVLMLYYLLSFFH